MSSYVLYLHSNMTYFPIEVQLNIWSILFGSCVFTKSVWSDCRECLYDLTPRAENHISTSVTRELAMWMLTEYPFLQAIHMLISSYVWRAVINIPLKIFWLLSVEKRYSPLTSPVHPVVSADCNSSVYEVFNRLPCRFWAIWDYYASANPTTHRERSNSSRYSIIYIMHPIRSAGSPPQTH